MTAIVARLAAQMATYATGDLLVRAAAFVLLPLYTRRLSLEAFGALGLVQMVEAILVLVLNIGMSTAVMRRRARRDAALGADMFSGFVLLAGGGALAVGLLGAAAETIARVIFGDALSAPLVRLVLAGVYFATLKLFVLSVLRADGRAIAYSMINVVHFVVLVGSSVLFVAGLDMGLTGAVLGQAASVTLVTLVSLGMIAKEMRPELRLDAVRALVAYGAPLMTGTLAVWVITMSNRLFLEHYRSVEEVGLYTLGFRIAMVLQIGLVTPFRTAWLPVLFTLDAAGLREVPRRVLVLFVAIGSAIALPIALFAPEIVRLVATPAYLGAVSIVPLLLAGYLLYGVYFNLDNGVVIGDRTRVYPLVTGVAAVVNVALNAWLVPAHGLMGAAVATLASYPVLLVTMYAAARRTRPIPYDLPRAAAPLVVATLLYLLAHAVPDAFATAARVAALVVYPLALVRLGIFGARERRALRRLVAPR